MMTDRHKLETIFQRHGYIDFKWGDPKEFVVAHWVRMKCMFGCKEYGHVASCPPNVPSVEECQKFFQDYSEAAIFHFKKAVAKPDDRHDWTRSLNKELLDLEKEVFTSGYEKAFLLFLDSCSICKACSDTREECKEPKLARPTPEALAMDVFSTVRNVGYSIEVLSDYAQEMNRFAFLLIK
jgi:predicted metal-binding protein